MSVTEKSLIILCGLLLCWALTHLISAIMWQHTVRVYRLHLPHRATVEDIEEWINQLAGLLRAPAWWDFFPRWPIGVELVATDHGITRLVVVPARLHPAVLATLAAALPGARLLEPDVSEHVSCPYPWVKAGEVRLRGTRQLLAVDRGQTASRHLLASLQPLRSGEMVRVQWLIVGARIPRTTASADCSTAGRQRTGQLVINARQSVAGVRWQQANPVLSAVCRVGVATHTRWRARALLRRVRMALRGLDVPYGRMVGR